MLTATVVIPNLDSPIIDQVIVALRQQTYKPAQIIVVGLDRPNKLAAHLDVIKFIDTGHPISPATARNMGATSARSDVICFLDADCVPAYDWVERLVLRHAAGARVISGGVSLPGGSYWLLCDNIAALADFLDCTVAGERSHLPSLTLSIERSLFAQIGGFDETFAPSGEDTDLSFRLRQRAVPLCFEPQARVVHYSSRRDAWAVWSHLRVFGVGYVRLYTKHMHTIGPSLRFALCRGFKPLAAVVAPVLAVLDTLHFFVHQPTLRRFWYAFPGVAFARWGWYVGIMYGR